MKVEIPTVFTPLRHRAVVRARRRRRGFGGPLQLSPRAEIGEAFGLRQSPGALELRAADVRLEESARGLAHSRTLRVVLN